jgi:succinyl-CoA synthetase alpha subunit
VSILINHDTRLLVHGTATYPCTIYAERMRALCVDAHAQVVATVATGLGGTWSCGLPVFDAAKEAVRATDANAALVCVPPDQAADAILETADAGIRLIVCVTSRVPVWDVVQVKAYLRDKDVYLIGPGSPGFFVPGRCAIGAIAGHILSPGTVGVLSRSGSLAYEVTWLLTQAGFGQSAILGIGDGLIVGTGFVDILAMYEDDPTTDQVVLLGEIGGQEEEMAAAFVRDHMTKPVVAFVAGQTAPAGRRMGHPGAIIEGYADTAQSKIDALVSAGARVAQTLSEIPALLEN